MHLHALTSMGVSFTSSHGYVEGRVESTVAGSPRLVGNRVVLEYPSHTGTDNVLMAAALAKGTTVIENAAREPEVSDLAGFLNAMGARITGAGTSRIEVEGVDALHPARHAVIPDRLVVATFLVAAGLAGGEVVVEDGRPDHMDMLIRKLSATGIRITQEPDGLRAVRDRTDRLAVGGRGHPALSRVSPPTTSRCWSPCSPWPTGWASSPRTCSSAGSATWRSCAAWGPTSAPRATTPWSGGWAPSRVRRSGPSTCGPAPRWSWPAWWPTGRR